MCGCAGFGANGPGVCCVCVVDASKNIQGKGFEAKRIVPALPGTLSVCVYVCLYIYMCIYDPIVFERLLPATIHIYIYMCI